MARGAKVKHGLNKTPLYNKWLSILQRTKNPKDKSYPYYGGRGIRIWKEWEKRADLFCAYISSLPYFGIEGYTLDRIDNDKDYEPGNLRWSSHHVQSANHGKGIKRKDRLTGAYMDGRSKKNPWVSSIHYNGKTNYLGRFKTKELAASCRDNFIRQNNLTEYYLNNI